MNNAKIFVNQFALMMSKMSWACTAAAKGQLARLNLRRKSVNSTTWFSNQNLLNGVWETHLSIQLLHGCVGFSLLFN